MKKNKESVFIFPPNVQFTIHNVIILSYRASALVTICTVGLSGQTMGPFADFQGKFMKIYGKHLIVDWSEKVRWAEALPTLWQVTFKYENSPNPLLSTDKVCLIKIIITLKRSEGKELH